MTETVLFNAAVKLPPEQQDAFLDAACAGRPDLRASLAALLAAHRQAAPSFLVGPQREPGLTGDIKNSEGRVGKILAERYRLLELLGDGGMGQVWLADQLEPVRRRVAVKLIKPGMDSRQVLARFETERQALALMDHPHIARIYDGGLTDEMRPFFVMEYVRGLPLTQYCDQARLSVQERLRLFVPVCQAVQHAHLKGVIHRDLKPNNILVCLYDGQAVPKVIDFGLAKALHQPLTEQTLHTGHGIMLGTPLYMSPEQAELNNLDIDTRSDVYALGVILYELLTGSTPLEGAQLQQAAVLEMLRLIKETEPAPPSARLSSSQQLPAIAAQRNLDPARLCHAMRGDLDWIVMKTLERNRLRRYESASALARDVERYLRDEPVEAGPPSLAYRWRKFVWKHRAPLTAFGVLAVLLATILGAAGMVWQERRRQGHRLTEDLAGTVEEASLALGQAIGSPVGRDSEWRTAKLKHDRVAELVTTPQGRSKAQTRARAFLARYQQAAETREVAEQIEEVVLVSATHADLASWTRMEQQFRKLFRDRGLDLDRVPPLEVARRIREHRSARELSEALELWIGTRGQLSVLGGPRATKETMQPWADAMFAADPDPVRTGIRRLIYAGRRPTPEQVEDVIRDADLTTQSPRTLSWLATVFGMAGANDRCDEVFESALSLYPSDLMLNFDYAYSLTHQARWQEAIRYYLRCLAIRPNIPGVWRSLGVAYRNTQELARSQAALGRAIHLEPEHAATHVDLADTLLALQEVEAALKQLQRARDLAADDPRQLAAIDAAIAACKTKLTPDANPQSF